MAGFFFFHLFKEDPGVDEFTYQVTFQSDWTIHISNIQLPVLSLQKAHTSGLRKS